MARIILSAPAEQPWSPGCCLIKALRDLGHEARLLDYRSVPDPEHALMTLAEEIKPAVHILFKGEKFTEATIHALKGRGIYTIWWHHDLDPDMPPWVMALARANDFMFNVSFGLIKEFQKRGVRNIEWLAQGFEESFYRFDRLTEEEQKLYSTDVVLVGRITPTRDGRHPGYAERARLIGRLLREGIRVTWWGPRIPRRLRNLRLLFSGVGRAWGGKFIFNQEYAKAATGAKVFLASEAQPEVERTLSSRIFAACGCGAFYLTQYARGIEEVFVPGREIAVFRGADEMVAQVRHYLQHEDERCAIAEAGRRRVLKEYTYQARFRRMFDIVRERDGRDFASQTGRRATGRP